MAHKVGLTREQVLDAAAGLADAGGPDGLTLKALAERLGVRTPSLYNYVNGLAGLQGELAVMGTRRLGARMGRAALGKSGDEAVVALAQAFRAFVKEHPGLYALTVRSAGATEPPAEELAAAEEEVVSIALAVLAGYGLGGQAAVHAARGLRAIVHGFATLEVGGGFGLPLEVDESFKWLVGVFVRGLGSVGERGSGRG